ncbi:MAG: hypothetical protein KatS3mg097_330 [Candidatus Parcubacteria bacterium]|nr:MAG: hypothetical protein KatS3mg097_330 [Candidatus Parcubacteria bacterium]
MKNDFSEIIVYTDGGSLNNPGKAAIGVVIHYKNQTKEYSRVIGENKTNNEAEYEAVIFALEKVKQLFGKKNLQKVNIVLNLDSELVGNQLKGKYKIMEEKLIPYFIKFHNLKIDLPNISINIIPREKNAAADALVKKSLFPSFLTFI